MRTTLLFFALLLSTAGAAQAQMTGIDVTILQRTTVSDQPELESITILAVFAPGATTGWHTHPGDEYAVVLEGRLALRSRTGPMREVAADSAYHNQRGAVHETVNETDQSAAITATFIIEKGQPISIPWAENNE